MPVLSHRKEFADFLLRLAADADREDEWFRLVVTHYGDEELEAVRRDLVRLSIQRNPPGRATAWQPEDRLQMLRWAEQLGQ